MYGQIHFEDEKDEKRQLTQRVLQTVRYILMHG